LSYHRSDLSDVILHNATVVRSQSIIIVEL
jgi:hypothetical protein